jgi:hypothetical protein
MSHRLSFYIAALAVACVSASPAQALDKAHPDSVSGHGQARDVWLLKGTERRANCGGPVSSQMNPNSGLVTYWCRVDGMVREVEKAPKAKGQL